MEGKQREERRKNGKRHDERKGREDGGNRKRCKEMRDEGSEGCEGGERRGERGMVERTARSGGRYEKSLG